MSLQKSPLHLPWRHGRLNFETGQRRRYRSPETGSFVRAVFPDRDGLEMRGSPVCAPDQSPEIRRQDSRQAETDVDRVLQSGFHRAPLCSQGPLQRADHVAEHVFVRIVHQCRQPGIGIEAWPESPCDPLHEKRVFRNGKCPVPRGLPVPARHAGETMGNVLDLDVEGRRIEQIEPSAAQHTLPGRHGYVPHPRAGPPTRKRRLRASLQDQSPFAILSVANWREAMTTATAFDTLSAAKRLEKAGFHAPQAEAVIETISLLGEAQRGELATKTDLLELEGRVNHSIQELDGRLTGSIQALDGRLTKSIHDMEIRLIRTMFSLQLGTALTIIVLTVGLLKLL